MTEPTEGSPSEPGAGGGVSVALNVHPLNHTFADSELLLSYAVASGVAVGDLPWRPRRCDRGLIAKQWRRRNSHFLAACEGL
jgi:hypothetical protein